MPPIIDSVSTILLITLLGWVMKQTRFVSEEQWNGFEHICYQVFFPALIIHALVKADLSSVPAGRFAGAIIGAVVLSGALMLLAAPTIIRLTGMSRPAYSSVFQGAIRWNTFMAFGLVDRLYGPRGMTLIAIALAGIIPIINVASVMVLRSYCGTAGGRFNPLGLLRNPFIWSSGIGLFLNLTGLGLPGPVLAAVDITGRASLAGALLLVGSGLRLSDLGKPDAALLISSVVKLFFLPLLAAGLGHAFGLKGADLGVLVLCGAVPTASAAYILSRQMGGDAPLMAAITTAQTLASALTLPIMLLVLAPG